MSASKSTRVRTVASTGRSSDLLRPERLPVVHEQTVAGVLFRPCAEAYSSGDCPGFSPDSLLIRTTEKRPRNRFRGKDKFLKLIKIDPPRYFRATCELFRARKANKKLPSGRAFFEVCAPGRSPEKVIRICRYIL